MENPGYFCGHFTKKRYLYPNTILCQICFNILRHNRIRLGASINDVTQTAEFIFNPNSLVNLLYFLLKNFYLLFENWSGWVCSTQFANIEQRYHVWVWRHNYWLLIKIHLRLCHEHWSRSRRFEEPLRQDIERECGAC